MLKVAYSFSRSFSTDTHRRKRQYEGKHVSSGYL